MSERLALSVPEAFVDAIAQRTARLLADQFVAAHEPEPYLSVEQAAEYMGGRPKSRIYDLTSEGKLRCRRDGRTVLTKRSWIDEYLAADEDGGR